LTDVAGAAILLSLAFRKRRDSNGIGSGRLTIPTGVRRRNACALSGMYQATVTGTA
jgi:hypothetical protein